VPVTLARDPDFYFTSMAELVAAHREEAAG